MHGMALPLLLAQRDQSQNFPADCQMHSDEYGCASKPTVADLRVHYPSREPIILILHMFPIWGTLPESSVVMAHLSHTASSSVLQSRLVMLRRRYAAFLGCRIPYTTTLVAPSAHVLVTYLN